MGGDKGDVETADEEARVEQPVARMAPRPGQHFEQRFRGRRCVGMLCRRSTGAALESKGQQGDCPERGGDERKSRLPAAVRNQPLDSRHQGESSK